MAELKKVLISLPAELISELDDVAKKSGLSRNRTIGIAIKDFLLNNKKAEIEKSLEQGYKTMADINSEWADFCLDADTICVLDYESKLTDG